ncbi:MAG TPA: glycosyltransferase family 4 protein [Sedimentisphaerales bacterium]|nr:glycosyltransferase family 4 protein [Sedimentisphaerales bacterium]
MEWPPHGCGIGSYMFNLARGLSSFGHRVTVITHDKESLPCAGVRIIPVQPGVITKTVWHRIRKWRMEPYHSWSLRAYKKFLKLCNSEKFDVIETAEFGAWGRNFVKNCPIPVVVRCHNPTHVVWAINKTSNDSWGMPLWLRFQDKRERRQTFYADAIVSPSLSLASHLSLRWVIPRSRFTVLPNPIDAELFRPGPIESPQSNEILYVGRLQYNKGAFDLAAAAGPLLKEHPQLQVRLVGMDGQAPEKLRQYGVKSSEAILSLIPRRYHSRVLFTNHIPVADMVWFYQKALCSVMPTRGFENFSYTVLEPMSCGCPLVATNCGGPAEVITDGFDGLLVEPGDTKALTGALAKLIEDRQLRRRLGRQARQTVQRRFALPVVIPRIVDLYEEVIRNHNKGCT